MDLRPQRFPTLRMFAAFGASCRISALIRSSCSTTSADRSVLSALIVRSSGSPGPAPTRNTLPAMADSLPEELIRRTDWRWDLIGRSVQEPSSLFGIHGPREQLSTNSSEPLQPACINRRQLSFEFATQALRQCGALPPCRDGDLQVPATNDRGVVEVATIWNIDDVAEDASGLRFSIDLIIDRSR